MEISAQARREMQRTAPLCFLFQRKRNLDPHCRWGRETKGVFSFAKENTPFGTPRERPDRQPRSRRSAAPPEWKHLRGGLAPLAAIGSAIRFDLLLLPAAALPILFQCGRIPSYRQSHQGGEQSKAAPVPRITRQKAASAAMPPSAGSPPPDYRHSRPTE